MEPNEPGAADYNTKRNRRLRTRVQSIHVIRRHLLFDIIHIHYLFTANVNCAFESNGLFVNFEIRILQSSRCQKPGIHVLYCYRFRGPHIYLAITYFCQFNYIIAILLCPKDVEAVGLPY